jgi:anaerobic magnesium-protoporphyrin IX monomethyl ester cyclase
MKILLIDATDKSWLGVDSDPRYMQLIPPIGLMYLGTVLKKELSAEVKICNAVIDLNSEKALCALIDTYHPDIIGIRGFEAAKNFFIELTKRIKRYNQRIPIVAGGPIISSDPEMIHKNDNIDYAVEGEGEYSFVEIIKSIQESKDKKKNNLFIHRSKIINSPLVDIENNPFPDYSLIDVEAYNNTLSYAYNRRRQGILVTSRGCPYRCTYCHNSHGKKFRARSAENVYNEIISLYTQHSIKDFYIIDDIFNYDYHRVDALMDLIIINNLKINLYLVNGVRADLLEISLIDKMVQAGLIWITFAVESASKRLQKYINKNLDLKKTKNIIQYSIQKDILVNYCAMVGFPTETKAEAEQTLAYLESISRPSLIPMYFALKYYKGTEIYRQGLSKGVQLEKYMHQSEKNFHDPFAFIPNKHISKADFMGLYKRYFNRFYKKENFKWMISLLKNYYAIEEIFGLFSLLFNKKINNYEEIYKHAK